MREIRRLLIANRGEIARRIARTASAMGISTVSVYTPDDGASPHVIDADRALPVASYLDIGALIGAARAAGADAVHPGYGFLSERAPFARAVLAAGLNWVGPPPDAIAALGDKQEAKRIVAAAGVPVLPTLSPEDPVLEFPVLVKASAGGGGKGMRIVDSPGDLAEAVAAARREAGASFGDDTVFVERYIRDARHVEVQVLADEHGHAVHCFERDCSIQRRHQKVIEEAPSPAVDAPLRERMGQAALAAVAAVDYRNAGTVEFVVEPSGAFWFLEVNTRLQVEHPVTEAVTGLDLVREQLRIAQGLPLSAGQADLSITGHAVEARLYAEDPAAGFLPATGTLVDWAPDESGVRWDAGVEAGSEVGVHFDPLLAKVIAHAPTRQEAALRLARALERSRIRGVTTNRDFLVAALRHPQFLAGQVTTSFIDASGVAISRDVPPDELRVAGIAAALADHDRAPAWQGLPKGWRNSVMPPERRVYSGREVTYRLLRDGSFDFDGTSVRLRGVVGGWIDFDVDAARHRVHVLRQGDRVWAQGPGGDVALVAEPRFPDVDHGAGVTGGLAAPMPGKVVSVAVAQGDAVGEGQLLLILEAMKMEHRVLAPRAGTVIELRAAAGDQVNGGDVLVVLA